MKYEEVVINSKILNRDFRVKIYGHYGPSMIIFPCQNKQSDDFYNYGMIDTLSDYLNDGKLKLFCVDSNDGDTVSSDSWDKAHAGWLLDQYHEFVIKELLPLIYEKNGSMCLPLIGGLSMGGSHAAISFFRRPELFKGLLCLSANYNVAGFFKGYMDEKIYRNSPCHFLKDMPLDHPWIEAYNKKRMILVVGQGRFENCVLNSNYWMRDILREKNINAWFDFWGQDSAHDWPYWKIQMLHYLPYLLEEYGK